MFGTPAGTERSLCVTQLLMRTRLEVVYLPVCLWQEESPILLRVWRKTLLKKEARNVFWSCQAPPLGLCNVRVLEVYSDVGLYFTRPSTHVDSYKKP